jgi:hypothetical protein
MDIEEIVFCVLEFVNTKKIIRNRRVNKQWKRAAHNVLKKIVSGCDMTLVFHMHYDDHENNTWSTFTHQHREGNTFVFEGDGCIHEINTWEEIESMSLHFDHAKYWTPSTLRDHIADVFLDDDDEDEEIDVNNLYHMMDWESLSNELKEVDNPIIQRDMVSCFKFGNVLFDFLVSHEAPSTTYNFSILRAVLDFKAVFGIRSCRCKSTSVVPFVEPKEFMEETEHSTGDVLDTDQNEFSAGVFDVKPCLCNFEFTFPFRKSSTYPCDDVKQLMHNVVGSKEGECLEIVLLENKLEQRENVLRERVNQRNQFLDLARHQLVANEIESTLELSEDYLYEIYDLTKCKDIEEFITKHIQPIITKREQKERNAENNRILEQHIHRLKMGFNDEASENYNKNVIVSMNESLGGVVVVFNQEKEKKRKRDQLSHFSLADEYTKRLKTFHSLIENQNVSSDEESEKEKLEHNSEWDEW